MIREFDVVVEKDPDGYYVASVPALRGCHTQARSLDKLMERVQEAIALCISAPSLARNVRGGGKKTLEGWGHQPCRRSPQS